MTADALIAAPSVLAQDNTGKAPLSTAAGFFFAFRLFFVLLAVRIFQQEADAGVAASLALNYLLLFIALLTSNTDHPRPWSSFRRQPCFRWVLAYTLLTGISLTWTVAASKPAAIAFWVAMAADTAIIFLQLRQHNAEDVAAAVMSGYIWGASIIASIAWLLPAQSDLRLGDEELLGPNQIGWLCAVAFFFAQYLIRRRQHGIWKLHAFLLAVTLLRTLSKTTIIAFIAAQGYILLRDSTITRKTRYTLAALAVIVCIAFYGLLSQYWDVYTTTGDQSENLTGRLGIWAYIAAEAIDKPFFGHGFHSVWKVIPPFYGTFEARHAHNEFIQQFYAYGAAGLAVLFGVYGSILRAVRRLAQPPMRAFFGGFLIFVVIRGLADTEVFDLSWPMWFLLIFGALAAQTANAQEATA